MAKSSSPKHVGQLVFIVVLPLCLIIVLNHSLGTGELLWPVFLLLALLLVILADFLFGGKAVFLAKETVRELFSFTAKIGSSIGWVWARIFSSRDGPPG